MYINQNKTATMFFKSFSTYTMYMFRPKNMNTVPFQHVFTLSTKDAIITLSLLPLKTMIPLLPTAFTFHVCLYTGMKKE